MMRLIVTIAVFVVLAAAVQTAFTPRPEYFPTSDGRIIAINPDGTYRLDEAPAPAEALPEDPPVALPPMPRYFDI